jgi:hypothetical protein
MWIFLKTSQWLIVANQTTNNLCSAKDLPSPWPLLPTAESNLPSLELLVTISMDNVCKMTKKAEEAKGTFIQALQYEADMHKRLLKIMLAVVEATEICINNADRFVQQGWTAGKQG